MPFSLMPSFLGQHPRPGGWAVGSLPPLSDGPWSWKDQGSKPCSALVPCRASEQLCLFKRVWRLVSRSAAPCPRQQRPAPSSRGMGEATEPNPKVSFAMNCFRMLAFLNAVGPSQLCFPAPLSEFHCASAIDLSEEARTFSYLKGRNGGGWARM